MPYNNSNTQQSQFSLKNPCKVLTKMKLIILFNYLLIFVVAANCEYYQAPDECLWSTNNDNNNHNNISNNNNKPHMTLICQLRTINSELESTNFSVIEPQQTTQLQLICNQQLFIKSNLAAKSLRTLNELQTLTIEYCKLSNIVESAFFGLDQLRNLTLHTHNNDWSNDMILTLTASSFMHMPNLQRLELSLNNIAALPEGIFCVLPKLQHLNMSHNNLKNLSSFHCLSALLQLDLSANKLTVLPSLIFAALNQLQQLNLSKNMLNFISARAFDGLNALTKLDLSNNLMHNLPNEVFAGVHNLQQLILHNNSIKALLPDVFNNVPNLLWLDLSLNELTTAYINAASFKDLKNLQTLNLAQNKLTKLEPYMFNSLLQLQHLILEQNFITVIADNTFAKLTHLQTLSLSKNRLVKLNAKMFSNLNALLTLSLDFNDISSIETHALKYCKNLQHLHLNRNQLKQVPDALKYATLLKTLDLGENFISHIENSSFAALEQLYGLRLTENQLTHLTFGIFERLTALQILNLSGNQVQSIDAHIFKNNAQLQAVRLDGNQLRHIKQLFNNLNNLLWLNISDNQLDTFDFTHIPLSLQWLDVHANRITQLQSSFESEQLLNLSTLDASYNLLSEINANSIPNSIEKLYLQDNLIAQIQPYTFLKKLQLKSVNLMRNQLTTLESNALRLTPVALHRALPKLRLSENPFQCDCKLDWLRKLSNETRTQPQLLDVNEICCKFSYIGSETSCLLLMDSAAEDFLCKYDTHCFALCHCCDFNACDCKMQCPSGCRCYHDQSWSNNVVDCAHAGYERQLPASIPMDATRLLLDGNLLPELKSHAFLGHKRLKLLQLNHTKLAMLHNRTFYGLIELQVLYLQHNNLQQLNNNDFHGLYNLQELYLQHNAIRHIEAYSLKHLFNLKVLRLDHNAIYNFAVWDALPSTHLNQIRLADNAWSCNCDFIIKFAAYIQNTYNIVDQQKLHCQYILQAEATTQNINNYEHGEFISFAEHYINCVGDNAQYTTILTKSQVQESMESGGGGGEHLRKVHKKLLLPQKVASDQHLYVLRIILICFVILLIILLLLFYYRLELRVCCHAMFGLRLFDKNASEHLNESEKLYDAFVIYSIKDEHLICDEFANLLEQKNYKLFLNQRDFPSANNYLENLIEQILENSNRTIIVLSKNFIKSEWCHYEFKSAYRTVFRDFHRRLIFVTLNDVPIKELDPDLRLYIKTNLFLKWGEKLFWQKLRYALPDKNNDNVIYATPTLALDMNFPIQQQQQQQHQQHVAQRVQATQLQQIIPTPPITTTTTNNINASLHKNQRKRLNLPLPPTTTITQLQPLSHTKFRQSQPLPSSSAAQIVDATSEQQQQQQHEQI